MTKRLVPVIVVLAVLGALGVYEALAQRGLGQRGGGGWGPGAAYARLYNPQTVETIGGEVVSVARVTPMKGMSYGVRLVLKTDRGTVSVHLGPGWYIENQDVRILPNDRVEVTGSRISFDGHPAIIAATVKKGDEELVLRDASGFPAWSGWRRR